MAHYLPNQFPAIDYNRGGSLTLRSNNMNYSRIVMNSDWHKAREAEPKDYDINRDGFRDFSISTYKRIGNITEDIPNTTYQDAARQIFDKKKYESRKIHKSMVNAETFEHAVLDRETGLPKEGFGAVLPHHPPDHNKLYLETTHMADFKSPYPMKEVDRRPKVPDYSSAYKKCHSQFTDTDDYRRPGRNTWWDESGIYANSHFKRQAPAYQPTKTILDQLK